MLLSQQAVLAARIAELEEALARLQERVNQVSKYILLSDNTTNSIRFYLRFCIYVRKITIATKISLSLFYTITFVRDLILLFFVYMLKEHK